MFSEFSHDGQEDNSSYEIAKNRQHPWRYFCEDKFRANNSDSSTETDNKKEKYFLHELEIYYFDIADNSL